MSAKKRVCVVGAGASGLPSIRHALLYGFDVVCYEGQDDIGGLWRYKPEETDESSVMKSTVINSSKELTAYSDFPPPSDVANYMHNTQMYAYLKNYADHFELGKYIKLNTKVLNVERASDYAKTGRWKVTVQDKASGATTTEGFDGVLMCSGHHTTPYWPEKWPGQDKFKGRIIHAHSYKDHKGYEDKVVVVVGVGNSGGDVTVEQSRIAKQVYLVSRRGTWVVNRIYEYGRPIDCVSNTRTLRGFTNIMPSWLNNYMLQKRLNQRFDHHKYGLQPKHAVFGAHPTVNDELPNRIACGTVKVKPQITEFTENGLHFTDGTSIEHVDVVVVSTGYSFEFPIIEHGNLIKVKDNEVDLYEYIFPLVCEHDSLGIIGLIQPVGSIMPISELQARVVLDVLAGNSKLPNKNDRISHSQQKKSAMAARYVKSRRHTIQVDYMPYMDELAELIGCQTPKWHEVLFSDPQLAMHILHAPWASYFYRLKGPHPWNGARQAILTIEDRIVKATNNRESGSIYSVQNASFMFVFKMLILAAILVYVLFTSIF